MKNLNASFGEAKTPTLLLEAAGETFAAQGFHGATIREITQRAGVNIAAVNYYFRDKDELYAAVLQHAHRASLKEISWEELSGEPAKDRVRKFVNGLLSYLLDPSRPKWHGMLMARELANPSPIFQQLMDEGLRPRCLFLANAIQEMVGIPLPPKKLQMIIASILGQCFFYRHSRAVAEGLFPELYEGKDWIKEITEHISNLSIWAIRAEFGPHGCS